MNKTIRKIGVAVGAMLMSLQLASCTFSDVDASTVGCVYSGGPLDGSEYKSYVKPGGGREVVGWLEDITEAPVRIIQYRITSNPETGDTGLSDAVVAKVRGIDQTYEPTATFTLSTVITKVNGADKPRVCTLIEKHLRPLGATDFNGGRKSKWVKEFLNERFRPVLDDIAIKVLQTFDPTDLAFNLDGDKNGMGDRDQAAKQIGKELTHKLIESLGEDYFCDPGYQFGEAADQCGDINIVLPAPSMSPENAALIAAPQLAETEANNDIAVAQEDARKAKEIAANKTIQAESAEEQANADVKIAEQQQRVKDAQVVIDNADCAYLASINQDCALVYAAKNGDFPNIFTTGTPNIAIAVPTEEATTTTVAGG